LEVKVARVLPPPAKRVDPLGLRFEYADFR